MHPESTLEEMLRDFEGLDERERDALRKALTALARAERAEQALERVLALPRYDLDGGTGYSTHCIMQRSDVGEYVEHDAIIDALSDAPE